MDEEEIKKAISLEESALQEFKRRKHSLPAPPESHRKSLNGKKNLHIELVINKFSGISYFYHCRQ